MENLISHIKKEGTKAVILAAFSTIMFILILAIVYVLTYKSP